MKKTLLWASLALVVIILLILTYILFPGLFSKSAGSSGQQAPTGFVSEVTAKGADGRERTLTAKTLEGADYDLENLTPGEVIAVTGSGYDASIGVYVGICKVPESADGRPSPCLGGIPDDAQDEKDAGSLDKAVESAWVTDNWAWKSFASHTYLDSDAGSFEVQLLVPDPVGEELNCLETACGVYTRADHTALSERVQDIYLPVKFRE